MSFDEYFDKLQKAWQCQHASAKLPINADADVKSPLPNRSA